MQSSELDDRSALTGGHLASGDEKVNRLDGRGFLGLGGVGLGHASERGHGGVTLTGEASGVSLSERHVGAGASELGHLGLVDDAREGHHVGRPLAVLLFVNQVDLL